MLDIYSGWFNSHSHFSCRFSCMTELSPVPLPTFSHSFSLASEWWCSLSFQHHLFCVYWQLRGGKWAYLNIYFYGYIYVWHSCIIYVYRSIIIYYNNLYISCVLQVLAIESFLHILITVITVIHIRIPHMTADVWFVPLYWRAHQGHAGGEGLVCSMGRGKETALHNLVLCWGLHWQLPRISECSHITMLAEV